jgi:hypothetical protein
MKIFNSFVFDNVAITFRTKGNTYRRSDRFIEIKSEKKDINGYWFIISIKHIFTDSVYENEITCVRFYLDKLRESLPLIASAPQTTTSPNQPAQSSNIANGSVDFQEPPLPEPGSEIDGSVLPPKQPVNNVNAGPLREVISELPELK